MHSRQKSYLGAYGVCIVADSILLIRKVRGPYKGKFDLPGGGIEFGESPEAALQREFMEETGLTVADCSLYSVFSKRVDYLAEDGIFERLHHIGIIYDVVLYSGDVKFSSLPAIKSFADGQDSGGAIWVPLRGLSEWDSESLTPFSQQAIFQRIP